MSVPAPIPPRPAFEPFAGLPDLPAIRTLRDRRQWVGWNYTFKPGGAKWTKPPVDPATGRGASHSDPKTWATYEAALSRANRDKLPGVGFVLADGDDVGGFDLDGCRDPATSALAPWAADVLALAETYAEVSPSGRGVRIFARGKPAKAAKCDPAGVEVYREKRYLTVTGRHIAGTPTEIRPAPRTLAALLARVDATNAAIEAEKEKIRAAAAAGIAGENAGIGSRLTPGTKPSGPGGSTFFRDVNSAAFADLPAWVPALFGAAAVSTSLGYRISSAALGRTLEEDLSITSMGAKDFGVHDQGDAKGGARTAIDLVIEHGNAPDAVTAARWLCERLGIDPISVGWTNRAAMALSREESSAASATILAGLDAQNDATAGQVPSTLTKLPSGPRIVARPYVWHDPTKMPRRQWVYGHHLIRRFLSTTVAPGAVGKSSLTMVEAIAIATGRNLLGTEPAGKLKVWIWNGEDPLEELERRVAAICIHYCIDPAELEGQLFLNSGRDTEIIIATTTKAGTVIAQPVVREMKETIRENKIDVVILDPFVACHGASENDNVAINSIAKTIARMADETNTAWDLVHHSRKTGGAEVTVEDGRGASALLAAARSGRVLNGMSREEAERAGIEKPRGIFRVDNGKSNLAPPPDKSEWFKLQSVSLGNGGENPLDEPDYVAVVTTWRWPDALADVTVDHLRTTQALVAAGEWLFAVQSKDRWVGAAVAQAMKLDHGDKAHRRIINAALSAWYGSGMLVKVRRKNEHREDQTFVEVGEPAND